MTLLHSFYLGKQVLVTGHTGFKGSWLCLWLAELGAVVHGYSLPPPTSPSLFEEARVASRLGSHHVGDIRDWVSLRQALRAVDPEIVFHLAAQPLVRRSYREPRETYEVNVMGTVNLLEAVRTSPGVRVCEVITSDKCYENQEESRPFQEEDRLGGHDPYSSSKACAELVVAAYRHSFLAAAGMGNCSLSSVRAGNVIGGGDWAEDRLLPDCVRALEKGLPIRVRHPQAVRPWQHVLEPLAGYLWLAACQWQDPAGYAGPWNFGPPGEGHVTVAEIVQEAASAWGGPRRVREAERVEVPGAKPQEAAVLRLDVSKAAARLGWRPLYDVKEAVRETIAWYRERNRQDRAFDGAEACLRQIGVYQGRAQQAGHPWACTDLQEGSKDRDGLEWAAKCRVQER